jgi:hypothetical protein
MPRDMDNFSLESIVREIVSILAGNIRFESIRLAQADKQTKYRSDDNILFFSVPGHVAVFDHTGIVTVHGDFRAELLPEIGSIATVVEIAMSKENQL